MVWCPAATEDAAISNSSMWARRTGSTKLERRSSGGAKLVPKISGITEWYVDGPQVAGKQSELATRTIQSVDGEGKAEERRRRKWREGAGGKLTRRWRRKGAKAGREGFARKFEHR